MKIIILSLLILSLLKYSNTSGVVASPGFDCYRFGSAESGKAYDGQMYKLNNVIKDNTAG